MVSKNLKIILGALCALFLVFGCLSSGAENQNTKQVKTVEPVKTVQSNNEQVQVITQDINWLQTTKDQLIILGQDMNDLSIAASSQDLEAFYRTAIITKSHINTAKNLDSGFKVSSKYARAHTEYLSMLNDLGDSMNLIIDCGSEGWTDLSKIQDAKDKMEQSKTHINNFSAAI